jgi:hypothetical protein
MRNMRRKKVMTTNGNGARRNVPPLAIARRLFPRKISGYVAELLVEVYALLSSGGKLTSFRPNIDIDHKDLVFDELGSRLRSVYIQVKCLTHLSHGYQLTCLVKFSDGKPITNDRFIYVFALLNVKTMTLEKIWLVPCKDFNRLATRLRPKGKGVVLAFEAHARKRQRNVGPGKWDRFEVKPEDLGPRFLSVIERARAKTPIEATGLLQMVARP